MANISVAKSYQLLSPPFLLGMSKWRWDFNWIKILSSTSWTAPLQRSKIFIILACIMIWLFQYKKLIRIFKRISKILYVYIVLLSKNPRNIIFRKIRNAKNLNQNFFMSTKKVPKIFTNALNNLSKKNHKKLLHFIGNYIR